MTNSTMQIDTSAELMENDILPKCSEVHTDPNAVRVSDGVLPKALAGVIRIEGLGYYDPDIVTYYGVNEAGAKTQLIQHVSQLNVSLVASAKHIDQPEPTRIGFRLATALDRAEDVTS